MTLLWALFVAENVVGLHMQGQASSGQQGREAGRLMLNYLMALYGHESKAMKNIT